MTTDYMAEALDLARRGIGLASPNPMVGAVVVRDGEVAGRGFHTWAGVKHAEVLALEQAGQRARGAALYVTLEPCAHQGRTGPCAEAVGVTGIFLAKLDGTAKGGIVLAICDELKIPIELIGVGEGLEDMVTFDAGAFVEALCS